MLYAISFVILQGRYHGDFAKSVRPISAGKQGFWRPVLLFFSVLSMERHLRVQELKEAYTCGTGLYPRTMELDTVCVRAHFSRHGWRSGFTLLRANNEKNNNYQLTWMRFSFLRRSWFFLFSKMCSAFSWAGAMSLPIKVADRAPIPGLVICISIWRSSCGTE